MRWSCHSGFAGSRWYRCEAQGRRWRSISYGAFEELSPHLNCYYGAFRFGFQCDTFREELSGWQWFNSGRPPLQHPKAYLNRHCALYCLWLLLDFGFALKQQTGWCTENIIECFCLVSDRWGGEPYVKPKRLHSFACDERLISLNHQGNWWHKGLSHRCDPCHTNAIVIGGLWMMMKSTEGLEPMTRVRSNPHKVRAFYSIRFPS